MPTIISNVSEVFGVYDRLEFIDLVELEGVKYALLLPLLEQGVLQEVVILAIDEKDEKHSSSTIGSYASVQDADDLARVYAIFARRNEGVLDPANVV